MGIVKDFFIVESYLVLWPLPRSCLRAQQWAMGSLELYSLGNMVKLGRVASSLLPSGFFNLPPFHYPLLGAPRGPAVTKILFSPSGTTFSPGVCTQGVDRNVTIHNPHRESLSQLCCGFGIRLRVNGWPLFGRTAGNSRFTCLQVLYVFLGFSCLCSIMLYSILALFELQYARRQGPYSQDEVWFLIF